MNQYKCDICGCYLDPGEGKRCEECCREAKMRSDKMMKIGESIRILDSGQCEMISEVI